jgi:hypothetical protein
MNRATRRITSPWAISAAITSASGVAIPRS